MNSGEVAMKRFDSSEGNVWKYVFEFEDAIAEAVLYRYESFEKRTVICCSVQSGCPVGCVFCGTGKKFIRNLTSLEIAEQIKAVLKDQDIQDINSCCQKFQIMFMSMGEPFLNIDNVIKAIALLHDKYPNAELLVSTIGIDNEDSWRKFIIESSVNKKVGLQFSLHRGFDETRNEVIPYANKFTVRKIRDAGIAWNGVTGRPVYLNYCVTNNNVSPLELNRIKDLFSPLIFNFTFSVVCEKDENMKSAGHKNMSKIRVVTNSFLSDGYNVRIFDPAGQDDIGGGCGQLWYTQKWIEEMEEKYK